MQQTRRSPTTQQAVEHRTESKPPRFEDAEFLNIDLHVRSRRSLAPLVAAWPWSYQPLIAEGRPDPRWLILNPRRVVLNAEAAAKELLQHIRSLRGEARLCWKQAHRRIFDIGVRAGGPGRAFEEVRLTPETLQHVGAAGAHIQVTVYHAEPQSRFVPAGQDQALKSLRRRRKIS
jgi:hypothetical protein